MTPRRRNSAWRWVALGLAVVATIYLSRGFFQRYRKTYPPNAFYQVKRADMLISLVEEGALRALNETVIRSSLEGINRIIYLIPEGSYVQKGDLLVELDSSGLRDRLNEQELSYQEYLFQIAQAEGNLKIQKSLAESQIKDAELKVENAQSDLEKYRDGDAPLLIKTVESRSGVLAEQVRIASERFARTEQLFKAGNATKSELEADALTLKREQLALAQYQEDLRLIKKYDQPNQIRLLQSNLDQAKAELDRLKQRTSNEIAQAESDLKTSQNTLEAMEQGLKTQRRRLESTKIFAPQNGLVVYASVSPFQFASDRDDRRRDEGRFRGMRGSRGGEDFSGEFRGGGRRGGRSSSLESSSGESSRGSTSESVASGNQRIASAATGTGIIEPGAAGTGTGSDSAAGTSGTSGSSGGGRSGGGGGGGSGGQGVSSAASAFASYASMRPSSAFGVSSAATNSAANGAGSTGSSSSQTTGGNARAEAPLGTGNQFGSRSSMQGFRDFGGFDFYGTPGILEEGTMVRQRQELIRLPDVSKMLAEVKIEEARVRQVRSGMTAYIQVKNIPHRRFKGTVRRVALMPDSQSSWMNPNVKVFPTDILVDEELPIVKPGVSATTEIVITNLTNVLSVPIQTVARLRGENVCYVKRGARVTPVPVTTGLFNDAFVEITSGLKEGDLVLLAPVSDEEVEETEGTETNNAEAANGRASVPASQPPPDQPPQEERRFQRPDNGSPDGSAPPEPRRNRPGSGRRPPNSQDIPE